MWSGHILGGLEKLEDLLIGIEVGFGAGGTKRQKAIGRNLSQWIHRTPVAREPAHHTQPGGPLRLLYVLWFRRPFQRQSRGDPRRARLFEKQRELFQET